MATSTFLTRIESYRDPSVLWPMAAVASVAAHGIVLLGLRPWLITLQPQPDNLAEPIPIQLLADPPVADPSVAEPLSPAAPSVADPTNSVTVPEVTNNPAIAPPPTVAPPPADLSAPRPVAPAPPTVAPTPAPVPPVEPAPPAVSSPSPSPLPTAPPAPVVPPVVTPPPADVTPPPSVTAPPTVEPAPSVAPPSVTPPSQTAGQVRPMGLQAAPYGRDFPDVPPRLLSQDGISVQPWLALCGLDSLGAIAPPGTRATAVLQLQVEATGEVSLARVAQSSGNSAIDNLVVCMVQRQLQLEPARVAGEPFITDAYLLTVGVEF